MPKQKKKFLATSSLRPFLVVFLIIAFVVGTPYFKKTASLVLGISSITYYVDKENVGGTCADSNVGTTLDKPLCTLTKAQALAQPGDTVFIRRGTYAPFIFTKSGSSLGGYITYQSYNNEIVVFDAAKQAKDGLRLFGASYIKISGFEVKNAGDVWGAGIRLAPNGSSRAEYNIIENNNVHHNDINNNSGIQVNDGSYNKIINNRVYDNYMTGIWIVSHDTVMVGTEIVGNKSYNNILAGGNADGIAQTGTKLTGSLIKNNETFNNGDDGIDTWNTSGNTIVGNIAHDQKGLGDGNGFKLGGALVGNNKIIGNISYSNKTNGFDSNGSGGNEYYNNVAYGNTGFGFEDGWKHTSCTAATCRTTFINNIGLGNTRGNISVSNKTTTTSISHNNIWYNSSSDAAAVYNYTKHTTLGGFFNASGVDNPSNGSYSSLSVNPLFVNAAGFNFNLLASSPAIDKGDPVNPGNISAIGVPDIGAFEFSVTTPSPTPTTVPTVTTTPTPTTTADTTVPTIAIVSPLQGSTVKRERTTTIRVAASDNVGVKFVAFSVNGEAVCPQTYAPFECKWTPILANTSYTITATAYDNANNSATTSIVVQTRK